MKEKKQISRWQKFQCKVIMGDSCDTRFFLLEHSL